MGLLKKLASKPVVNLYIRFLKANKDDETGPYIRTLELLLSNDVLITQQWSRSPTCIPLLRRVGNMLQSEQTDRGIRCTIVARFTSPWTACGLGNSAGKTRWKHKQLFVPVDLKRDDVTFLSIWSHLKYPKSNYVLFTVIGSNAT